MAILVKIQKQMGHLLVADCLFQLKIADISLLEPFWWSVDRSLYSLGLYHQSTTCLSSHQLHPHLMGYESYPAWMNNYWQNFFNLDLIQVIDCLSGLWYGVNSPFEELCQCFEEHLGCGGVHQLKLLICWQRLSKCTSRWCVLSLEVPLRWICRQTVSWGSWRYICTFTLLALMPEWVALVVDRYGGITASRN